MNPILRARRKGRPEPLAGTLGELATQARDQLALANALREALRHDLREGFAASDLTSAGTLTVFAAAPEWAARLRFETERLEQAARNAGWTVRQVRIKVAT